MCNPQDRTYDLGVASMEHLARNTKIVGSIPIKQQESLIENKLLLNLKFKLNQTI